MKFDTREKITKVQLLSISQNRLESMRRLKQEMYNKIKQGNYALIEMYNAVCDN